MSAKTPRSDRPTAARSLRRFSLATGERQKDGQGNWQDKTEWHNLVAFNRTAEIIRDYVRKGSQLMIEGKIQTRSWDDRESGEKKYRTEIFVNDMTLLGGHRGRAWPGFQPWRGLCRGTQALGIATPSNGEAYSDREISDDDIPF